MNASAFHRRYLGLAVLTLIGVGVSLPLLSISAQADQAARTKIQEGAALRSIEILPQSDVPGGASLTPQKLSQVRSIPGVQVVEPTLQATFGIKTAQIEGALLHGTKLRPSLSPPVTKSVRTNLFPLTGSEVVLPNSAQGMSLSGLLGKTIDVSYQQTIRAGAGRGTSDAVQVVGLYDSSWQLEGADAAFVADPTLLKWAASIAGVPQSTLLATVGYDKATVLTTKSDNVAPVLKRLQGMGFSATSLEQQLTELPAVLKLIHTLSRVFVIIIAVFLILASSALSSSLVRQRTREIGLLKAIGYRTRSIIGMFLTELALIGVLFSLLGIALGAGISLLAAHYLANYPDLTAYVDARQAPSIGVLLLVLVLPVGAVILGGARSTVRGALLQPSTALRDW
jgi:putative ABC transport system permease protein